VVVEDIFAVTVAPVVALRPVAGLHVYVFAPDALSRVFTPGHTGFAPADAETVGSGFTVTVTLAVFVQPAALLPVTVYVVVAEGFAVTVAPLVLLSPVAGLQLYVAPPEAVNEVEAPAQIAGAEGLTEIVGNGFTVTVTVPVPVHPLAAVPVTV
jgi:hypothetical protein